MSLSIVLPLLLLAFLLLLLTLMLLVLASLLLSLVLLHRQGLSLLDLLLFDRFFCFCLRDPNMFCPWRFSRHRSNFCRAFLSRTFTILLSITRVSYCLKTLDEQREFGARPIMTINKVQFLPYNGI